MSDLPGFPPETDMGSRAALAEAIAAPAWIADAEGRLEHVNRRWIEYLGSDDTASWLERALESIHPEDRARWREFYLDAIRRGVSFQCEARWQRADGAFRRHVFRAEPARDALGAVSGWIGTATDVEIQRCAERVLREANQRKNDFMATLAHELRGPLAPIHYAVHLLHIKGPLEPELRLARDMIDRQVRQLTRLVDDLLDMSRLSHRRLEVKREPTELGSVLRTALESRRAAFEQAGHEVTLELPAPAIWIDGDRLRLVQVFANLLKNASQYSERGGVIHVKVELMAERVRVVVRDHGIGIDAERLTRIFDGFGASTGVPERSPGGLGLGLSLARSLVELHGGTIEAHSPGMGAGSEFVVELPVLLVQDVEPREAAPREVGSDCRRVLVVDDNADSAGGLGALLEMRGYEVRLASEGEAALAIAESFRPDAVFLDIGLPGLDGYQVARQLRAQPWGRALRLVAVTGWGDQDDRDRARRAGFDEHLVKPVPFERIERILIGR